MRIGLNVKCRKTQKRSQRETFSLTPIEEHVTHDSGAAVYFEGVSAEDDPLQHDTPRIAAEQTTCGHEVLDALRDKTTKSLMMKKVRGSK